MTTLGVGGNARYFVRADSEAVVEHAVAYAEDRALPLHVLGGGSNVVVSDSGVEGMVLHVDLRGRSVHVEGRKALLRAAAGEPWDALVAFAVERGLQGLECLSGIPGRVGATPIQNVGAYGQEVSETIRCVRAFDRPARRHVELAPAACRFGYRDSLFKRHEPDRYIVLGVDYELTVGGAPAVRYPELESELAREATSAPELAEVRRAVLAIRGRKSMLVDTDDENRRSCGSFFVNPVLAPDDLQRVRALATPEMPEYPQADGRVKLSAAWLIEHAGFTKGFRRGSAGLSTRHALALVCHDAASASDLVKLATAVRDAVRERLGVTLVPEPSLWGFTDMDGGLPVGTLHDAG
jgi:UDP-N-acetylmuramate dehydrogenase